MVHCIQNKTRELLLFLIQVHCLSRPIPALTCRSHQVSRLGDELREKENKMIMMTQRQPLGVDWKSNHVVSFREGDKVLVT